MAESGFDPKVLQYVMGHSNIAVAMEVYNHITGKERIRKEFDRIDEIMAGRLKLMGRNRGFLL